MLQSLTIRDFVIVDRLDLEFAGGFGALTGETGAGKSILIDALMLALGERAEASVVRRGAARAEVVAEFSCAAEAPIASWLADHGFASDGCLLKRVIEANGRSRAWINGSPATLGQLREVAAMLCDIHGQHAHLSLLQREGQRALLDAQAGAETLAREVASLHAAWQACRAARRAAEADAEALTRERELLAWQVKELTALEFDAEAWQDTEREQRRLAHAAGLIEASEAVLTALEDEDAGALAPLRQACRRLAECQRYDTGLAEIVELFESALIQLAEAASALRRYRDRLDLDPARLAALDARIEAVTQMARKHRVGVAELPELLARLTARLAALEQAADLAALAAREQAAAAAYQAAAQRLSERRHAAAAALAPAVTEAMQTLAMEGGRFEIALTPLAEGGAHGLESVEFLVSAHAGQPLQPLAKVASGGELSRIGLALQVIASQARTAETLIFDEVDVGIGGRVAEIVGRRLRELGRSRQVLCVTHLPQVAACADWQWSVRKEMVAGEALSRVMALSGEARVEEIARMLGGMAITDTTRRHARELLDVS